MQLGHICDCDHRVAGVQGEEIRLCLQAGWVMGKEVVEAQGGLLGVACRVLRGLG